LLLEVRLLKAAVHHSGGVDNSQQLNVVPTKKIFKSLQTFINRFLRRIFKIFWPETISNERLWQMTEEKPIIQQIKDRKWQSIGHTLRKDPQTIERQVLNWDPLARRKRGRPKRTWRRTVEEGIGKVGKTWKEVEALAQNRIRWRCFVEAMCS
jgi:hypothetical protein